MSEVIHSPSPTTNPFQLLRAALRWSRIEGLHVSPTAELGVVCVSSHATNRWRRDPFVNSISPVGALVLMSQPRSTHPWAAAAEALGGSMVFSEGVIDGIAKLDRERKTNFGAAAKLFLDGFEVGLMVRRLVMSHADLEDVS